jgi:hypothetical protein
MEFAPMPKLVMPGLVPGIHVLAWRNKTWMAGTSPAMTKRFLVELRG